MSSLTESTAAHLVLVLAGLAVLVAVGAYIVSKVRNGLREDTEATSDMLTNFRDLHAEGELSDREYRTIKAMLSARMRDELKDSGKEG